MTPMTIMVMNAAFQPYAATIRVSAGAIRILARDEPDETTAEGSPRLLFGNHPNTATFTSDAAGPSAAPRRIRLTNSAPNVPTNRTGICTSDQSSAITSSTQTIFTRSAMNPPRRPVTTNST
jgi:hypothetical protein